MRATTNRLENLFGCSSGILTIEDLVEAHMRVSNNTDDGGEGDGANPDTKPFSTAEARLAVDNLR